MLNSKYQKVGVLAGVLMYLGAWLTGYYHHWIWAVLTVVVVLATFWYALDEDASEELTTRVMRGFSVGVLAAIVARVLGLLTMAWTYDSWSNTSSLKYSSISDAFRVMFNGRFWSSIVFIIGSGVVSAFVAYAIPYFSAEREEE